MQAFVWEFFPFFFCLGFPCECIWPSGVNQGWSWCKTVLQQIAKLLEQMVRVSWRKTLNRNHVLLGLVVSNGTTNTQASCQSLFAISTNLAAKRGGLCPPIVFLTLLWWVGVVLMLCMRERCCFAEDVSRLMAWEGNTAQHLMQWG